MAIVSISIQKQPLCPNIVFADNTVYPTGSETQDREDFNTFTKLYLTQPNGSTLPLSSISPYNGQILYNPDQYEDLEIETCMIGVFGAKYISLPTPRASRSQDSTWESGDAFYYNGVIYQVMSPVTIPNTEDSNETLIGIGLANGSLLEIPESDIPSNYISEFQFTHFCGLVSCLRRKLRRINCLIKEEPTRTDICEMKLYEQILILWAYNTTVSVASYYGSGIVPVPDTPQSINYYKVMSNYINPLCCCGNSPCRECEDCNNLDSDNLMSPDMTVEQTALPADYVEYFSCVESNLKTSFCDGCNSCDICKNPKAGNIIKATLLTAELQLYGGSKTSQEYLDMLSSHTNIMKILCQC